MEIIDDTPLMELMIDDLKKAPEIYRPTVYWARFQEDLAEELRQKGLKDFRRRKESHLDRFGAVDIDPVWDFLYNTKDNVLIPLQMALKLRLKFAKNEKRDRYDIARKYGEERNARPLSSLQASEVGNPEDIFDVERRKYTTHLLTKYVEYAYASKFLNFDKINTVMEIGAGAGKQVEVLRKLHPHLCFYLFDIAPEQYVCQQYLSALFPNDVISYRDTRQMTEMPTAEKGKIFIFGNWKLPSIKNLEYDLFWNSASLDETELPVAQNYLSFVNKQARYIYLKMTMKGVRHTQQPVTIENIKPTLSNFKQVDASKMLQLPKILPWISYRFTFWEKFQN
jgi:putative sugar O-methyltransferase